MKENAQRTNSLAGSALALLDKEQAKARQRSSAVLELVASLRADSQDLRLHRLEELAGQWRQHSEELIRLLKDEFLARLQPGRDAALDAGHRRWTAAAALLAAQPFTIAAGSDALLGSLMAQTGAEREFVLFWNPESTEADIIAARNYRIKVLSTEEYQYSRTLLRRALAGEPLRLDDAAGHPHFGSAQSVMEFQIRSVLAAPLADDRRPVGAIYLENNSRPGAFGPDDLPLAEEAGRMFMSLVRLARLLPVLPPPQARVFLDSGQAPSEIIGRDPAILAILDQVRQIADAAAAVLIEGASGTGKELVARALHIQSKRRDRPLMVINCAAIPEALLESELFGHEKGAFTGAAERYIGQVEQAAGGTVFFDEVGELPLPLQSKLLRFLQYSEFHRLGDSQTRHVDVRVVAATSRDLQKMMQEERFLESLYYRLRVIPIRLPKLAERKGDIPLLIEHFRVKYASESSRPIHIEPDVIAVLKEHPFPGNVRELENLIQRLIALSTDGRISLRDLPPEFIPGITQRISLGGLPLHPALDVPVSSLVDVRERRAAMKAALDEQEHLLVTRTIAGCGGDVRKAAQLLGSHWTFLYKIIRRHRGKTPGGPDAAASPPGQPEP